LNADIIIPTTKLQELRQLVLQVLFQDDYDCYPAAMQFLQAEIGAIQDYNENFLNLSPDQKQKLVEDLRTETIEKKQPYSFFTIVRDLTFFSVSLVQGIFTNSRQIRRKC
jgi:transcription termination factor NusB